MTLWIPRRALEHKFTCRVPTEDGVCGAKFYAHESDKYERHVADCAKAHEELLEQISMRRRWGIWGGEPVVPDLEAWVAKHRQAIWEGRKKL